MELSVLEWLAFSFSLVYLSSSSSDSDSDPEGGEIPDLSYSKDDLASKKKSKKKRSDKAVEDRIEKLNKKREVTIRSISSFSYGLHSPHLRALTSNW